jgi:hypothetical protein
MVPYLIILYISIALSFIHFVGKKENKYQLLFIIILLGLLSGSRYEIGGSDYYIYENMYNNVSTHLSEVINPSDNILMVTERGYIAIMALSKKVGLNYNQFLLLLGIATSITLFLVIKNYTNYFFLILLLFICKGYLYYFFTAQRQIIAILICWYAIKFVLNRKFKSFAFFVLIASLFHSSAIVFLIVYFTYAMELKNKFVIILFFISIIFGSLHIGPRLLIFISNYLPIGAEKLINYSGGTGSVNVFNFIEMVPIMFLILKHRNIISRNTKHFSFFFPLFLIYIFINFAFYDFSIMTRVRGYFIIGYISIIASIPYSFKTQAQKNIVLVVLVLYFSAVFIRELMVFDGGTGYLPYNSYLF